MNENQNKFIQLAEINVNTKTEKKGNLTYLSWAWAVDQLLRQDGAATWSYPEAKTYGDTMMVFCTVNAFGKSMTAQLPVMDNRNKALPNPDAFQVNVSMQRCLAKAIALHGLGLYIYAGEDLPANEHEDPQAQQPAKNALKTPANTVPVATPHGVQERTLDSSGAGWRDVVVPPFIKKYAGATLGEMAETDLLWWADNYTPKTFKGSIPQKDLDFRASLDAAKAELNQDAPY